MTQVLKEEFEFKESGDLEVWLRGSNINGNIVACFVEETPPSTGLIVTHIQSGNVMVLLPDGGVPVEVFNRVPLKLAHGIAMHAYIRLRGKASARGRVYAVVHMNEPVRPPPTYGLGLIPQPSPFGR